MRFFLILVASLNSCCSLRDLCCPTRRIAPEGPIAPEDQISAPNRTDLEEIVAKDPNEAFKDLLFETIGSSLKNTTLKGVTFMLYFPKTCNEQSKYTSRLSRCSSLSWEAFSTPFILKNPDGSKFFAVVQDEIVRPILRFKTDIPQISKKTNYCECAKWLLYTAPSMIINDPPEVGDDDDVLAAVNYFSEFTKSCEAAFDVLGQYDYQLFQPKQNFILHAPPDIIATTYLPLVFEKDSIQIASSYTGQSFFCNSLTGPKLIKSITSTPPLEPGEFKIEPDGNEDTEIKIESMTFTENQAEAEEYFNRIMLSRNLEVSKILGACLLIGANEEGSFFDAGLDSSYQRCPIADACILYCLESDGLISCYNVGPCYGPEYRRLKPIYGKSQVQFDDPKCQLLRDNGIISIADPCYSWRKSNAKSKDFSRVEPDRLDLLLILDSSAFGVFRPKNLGGIYLKAHLIQLLERTDAIGKTRKAAITALSQVISSLQSRLPNPIPSLLS